MKIHFGGSSLGLKKIRPNYLLIRKTLKNLKCTLARDWLSPNKINLKIKSGAAFLETVKAIGVSDAVILEGTYDTSSIGKQLILSLNEELPVLILISEEEHVPSNLNTFIDKKHSKLVHTSIYNEENLSEILSDFLEWAEKNTKIARFNLELERSLDSYLKKKALHNKTSKAEEIRRLIIEDMRK